VKGGRFAGAVGTRKASRWMSDRNGPRADVMNERSGRTGDRVREALQSRCGLNTPLFRSSARRVPSRQPATRGAGRRTANRLSNRAPRSGAGSASTAQGPRFGGRSP
jgi:hypothetical protein